jgi:hypothetical protein
MGPGKTSKADDVIPILFTGLSKRCGQGRRTWVEDMQKAHGGLFHIVEQGVYGRKLADLIARSLIVVAPDAPVSDSYYSCRLFLTLGFQGFLLHPYSRSAVANYRDGVEVVYYRSRPELHELIANYLPLDKERERIAKAGYDRTAREHTYIHRCRKLLTQVAIHYPHLGK